MSHIADTRTSASCRLIAWSRRLLLCTPRYNPCISRVFYIGDCVVACCVLYIVLVLSCFSFIELLFSLCVYCLVFVFVYEQRHYTTNENKRNTHTHKTHADTTYKPKKKLKITHTHTRNTLCINHMHM